MKHAFKPWWVSRSAQEHVVMVAAALCVGLVLYVWLLQTTTQARRRLLPAVSQLRAQALHQGEQVDEIKRLRATPTAVPSTTTDLRQLMQRQLDASGLSRSVVSVEQVDATHAKLVFGSVAFADWLTWADTVQAQQLRFSAVRVEAQDTGGQVSVTVTVERPAQ